MKKTLYLLAFLALLVPSLSFASFDVSLKYGSRGDSVSELQDFLKDQNFLTGKVDGRFGLGTLRAVKAFQTANGLTADGYFGKLGRAKANELLAAELKSSDDAEQAETGSVGAPVVEPTATITPTTDVATQAKIDALTNQLKSQQDALDQIAKNTAPKVEAVVLPEPPKVLGFTWLIPNGVSLDGFGKTIPMDAGWDFCKTRNFIDLTTNVDTTATIQLFERIIPEGFTGDGDKLTSTLNQQANSSPDKVKTYTSPYSTHSGQLHSFCFKDLGLESGKDYVFSFLVTDKFGQTTQEMFGDHQFISGIYIHAL